MADIKLFDTVIDEAHNEPEEVSGIKLFSTEKGTALPKKSREEVKLEQYLKKNGLTMADLEKYDIDEDTAKKYFTEDFENQTIEDTDLKSAKRALIEGGIGSGLILSGLATAIASAATDNKDVAKVAGALSALGAGGLGTGAVDRAVTVSKLKHPEKLTESAFEKEYKSRKDKADKARKEIKKVLMDSIKKNGYAVTSNKKIVLTEKEVDDYINSHSYSDLMKAGKNHK